MLSGPQRKFCEGVVAGDTAADAYAAAYPNAAHTSSGKQASKLLATPEVQEEIARLRDKADHQAGSAVMTLVEKRSFLARIVRARPALLEDDSDLWQSVKRTKDSIELKLPDKLSALSRDSDLAGESTDATATDALSALLSALRK